MPSWWTASRIDATVTRKYVQSQLVPEEIARLDQPVAFGGEDLTERTYWESINDRAKRLFLILVDVGVPDQIFGIIDDGWDDTELPLGFDHVERLQLTASKDDRVDRKFYQRQFDYLVKTVNYGQHVDYADYDIIPVDVVERNILLGSKGNVADRVKLPNAPNQIFSRRRYPLTQGSGFSEQEFFDVISSIRTLQNNHMVSYWASYTHKGFGYIILGPCCDYTLKSFLSNTPSSFKNLSKMDRRALVMNWILCLIDTICFLHSQECCHGSIKPSSILFSSKNQVLFADPYRLSSDAWIGHTDKSSFDREWYDYAAPEQWARPGAPSSSSGRKATLSGSFSPPMDAFGLNIMRGMDGSYPYGQAPMPQPTPQQADIFSLGCIILELLSFLVKRSSSKFATFRSAKHKTAGRGGAVLDTSFHKNLGQVESWMSGVAKDASKKVSDADGGSVFRGIVPMLHVVTSMLAASPFDRPSAYEVQQRIYQILTDQCGISEPHCVHEYGGNLSLSFSQLQIQSSAPRSDPRVAYRQPQQFAPQYGMPRSFYHMRGDSADGQSHMSGSPGNSTTSSEHDVELSYATSRGVPISPRARSNGGWTNAGPYMAGPSNQAPYYATAQYS